MYYVYTLSRPNGKVFYVGKGQRNRVHQHEAEARKGHKCHKCNVIRKIWSQGKQITKEIVFRTDDEQAAYDYERDLVNETGFQQLTNRVPGGGVAQRKWKAPNKPRDQWTDDDHIARLKSIPKITQKAFDEALEYIRRQRLEHCQQEWRKARRTWRNKDADRWLVEARELFVKLDIDTDWPEQF